VAAPQLHTLKKEERPIVSQNSLNNADLDKDVPFGVKVETYCSI